LNLYAIKQAVINLSDTNFFRFYHWFEKFGCDQINRHAKSSRIRQAVLSLSDEELDGFSYWLDDEWSERWREEVDNDPVARKCLELGNLIMSKPDPAKFIADLLKQTDKSDDKK
jgi:hypothetical protein